MQLPRQATIEELMDEVEAYSQTEEAIRRQSLTCPTARFNIESPLAEVKIFGWENA